MLYTQKCLTFFPFLQAAEFLDIPDLFAILTQKSTENSLDRKKLVLGLEDLCLSDGVFSDILFKLEDGTCAAHKPILMARFVIAKKSAENHAKIFDFEENICRFLDNFDALYSIMNI